MDFRERRKLARLHARGRFGTLQRMLEDKAKAKNPPPEAQPKPKMKKPKPKLNPKMEAFADRLRVEMAMGANHFEPKVYTSAFESGRAFGSYLRKRGFIQLGSGAFSTVFAKEGSDRVIKVTNNPDNWIDYVQWAAQNGYAGTYAPKVFSYKKIGDFTVSVVERMEKPARDIRPQEDLAFVDHLASYYLTHNNTVAGVFLDELLPGMCDFLTKLRKEFIKDPDKERLDMHGGNFMVRKDGSYCFTDPVCGKSKTTSNRLKAKDFVSLASAKFLGLFIEYCTRHRM